MTIITEDGVEVSVGDRVFNYYDMRIGTIASDPIDGWFDLAQDGRITETLNGERVCSIPFAIKRGWIKEDRAGGMRFTDEDRDRMRKRIAESIAPWSVEPMWHDVEALVRLAAHAVGCSTDDLRNSEMIWLRWMVKKEFLPR